MLPVGCAGTRWGPVDQGPYGDPDVRHPARTHKATSIMIARNINKLLKQPASRGILVPSQKGGRLADSGPSTNPAFHDRYQWQHSMMGCRASHHSRCNPIAPKVRIFPVNRATHLESSRHGQRIPHTNREGFAKKLCPETPISIPGSKNDRSSTYLF